MLRLLAVPAVFVLASTGLLAQAQAQYIGPGTTRPPASLIELLRNPIEGQGVQLRGRIVQQVNGTKYLFSDGLNQIRIQITNELFPRQTIDERNEIEIVGRVETDFMETPEIDVSSVVVIEPEQDPKKR